MKRYIKLQHSARGMDGSTDLHAEHIGVYYDIVKDEIFLYCRACGVAKTAENKLWSDTRTLS